MSRIPFIICFCMGICLLMAGLPGCKKAEDVKISAAKPEKKLIDYFGNSVSNRVKIIHLYRDTVYTLSENFNRYSGEELIIDEGTLIKVNPGGSLVTVTIWPGGALIANGTRNDPIVFTANAKAGTQGLNWGGLVVKGKAPISNSGNGGDPTDFSGSLNYVRIEFAGLTLESVGNRSILENVQVSYSSLKSSFVISGGTCNMRNVFSYACGGPADFYFSNGYSGRLQYVYAYRHPYFANSGTNPVNAISGVFIENNPFNPTAAKPVTSPAISNLTILGPGLQNGTNALFRDTGFRSAAIITTGNSFYRIRNSVCMGYPGAAWYIDDSLTAVNFLASNSEFSYSYFQCPYQNRTFYLLPGAFPPFLSNDFMSKLLESTYHNKVFQNMEESGMENLYKFQDGIIPLPAANSVLVGNANFDGSVFSDPFFEKVNFAGASGPENRFDGWSNLLPLKTNYNFPQ